MQWYLFVRILLKFENRVLKEILAKNSGKFIKLKDQIIKHNVMHNLLHISIVFYFWPNKFQKVIFLAHLAPFLTS